MRGKKVAGLVLLICFLAHDLASAQGGPPLLTDDPDTPGPGFWEINLASIVERSSSSRRAEAPLADINYGVGERIQLKFEIPWVNTRDGGRPIEHGLGPATVGVKWRFLGEEGRKVAWSIYPQVEIDTKTCLVPTEITFEVGPIEINGELGKLIGDDAGGGWRYGLSTELEVLTDLELLGELHGERTGSSPAELVANFGGRYKLTRQIVVLMAAGTGVRGSTTERLRLRVYLGLQFNLPGQYVFKSAGR